MFIKKITLQNYRCFDKKSFSFDEDLILIEGSNGSGKTSILEALNYGCFLKSFRTNRVRDLVSLDESHFFLQVDIESIVGSHDSIQIGLSVEKGKQRKLVKINKKAIQSYKDLVGKYRTVSLSEDDLFLVQGSPEVRRGFLDQLIVLFKPGEVSELRKYKQVLEQRNKMLYNAGIKGIKDSSYEVWTSQLWKSTRKIQKERISLLKMLEEGVNKLLGENFEKEGISISLKYARKVDNKNSFEAFYEEHSVKRLDSEYRFQRSLFGAHLDDFSISFEGKKARYFASRGQQKLVLFLIKIAIVNKLQEQGKDVVLLLDDFLTDFDESRILICLNMIDKLKCQTFITSPITSVISRHISKKSIQTISL